MEKNLKLTKPQMDLYKEFQRGRKVKSINENHKSGGSLVFADTENTVSTKVFFGLIDKLKKSGINNDFFA